jgi:hypothetical protein
MILWMPIAHRRSLLLVILLTHLLLAGAASAQSYVWQWGHSLSSSDKEEVTGVAMDNASGASYACGYTEGNGLIGGSSGTVGGNVDAFVMKYDQNGVREWAFTPTSLNDSRATGIALDAAGNIYVCGWFKGVIDIAGNSALGTGLLSSSGNIDWFIASFSPNGILRWKAKLGGSGDDLPAGIAVSGDQVSVFGTVKGRITTSFGSISNSLPSGKENLVIVSYGLNGTGQWLISGGSGDDEIPRSIAKDASRVFVAFRAKNNPFRWYDPAGAVLSSHSNSTDKEVRISAFSISAAHLWTTSLFENDNVDISGAGMAAGCDALYYSSISHSPCTFPGVGVVNTGTHDFFYLGRIDPNTGLFQWVTTGTTTGSTHTIGGTGIAIGRAGAVHVVGNFKDDVSIDGNTLLSSTGKVQPFVATFRSSGILVRNDKLTSSKDAWGACIASDAQGRLAIGGRFNTNISSSTIPLTGPSNDNGYLFKGSIANLGGAEPSAWTPPGTMCSNAGPFSLNSLLIAYGSGPAVSVANSSNVVSPNGALGAVLGSYAQFNTAGGHITVDLGVTVPSGTTISVLWRTSGASASANILSGTTTSPTASAGTISTASNSAIYSDITLSGPARYIRLQRPSSGSSNFEVDGIYYSFGNDLSGTWSGPGVSGSTFNPAGLSGAVALTYTVGSGSCASSTTDSIQVTAAPNAGTNGTLSTCSGSPAASLFAQLGGTPQTGGIWSGPSPVVGGMFDPSNMSPGNYMYTVAPTGICAGSATASASVTVGATPSGGTFTGNGVVCPSPATGTLTITGYSGTIVRWRVSTNGGTLWTSIGSTNSSITWSNLTGPTQYMVELSQPGCGTGFSPVATLMPQDMIAPSIICPAVAPIQTAYATPSCSMQVPDFRTLYTASDNCTATPTIVQDPAANTFVPFAEYLLVQLKAVDAAGNGSASCMATIIGVDTLPPTYSCPGDVNINTDPGACGASRTFSPIGYSDNCYGNGNSEALYLAPGNVSQTPLSIFDPTDWVDITATPTQTLSLGDHTVAYVHENGVEDVVLCSQIIRVTDSQPPQISCPAGVLAITNTGCTATGVALGTPVSSDNCGVASVTNDAPAVFPIGVTTVTWTVTDNAGSTATCTQTVTVSDNVPPTITCPADVAVNTNSGCTATGVALGTPVSSDNCGVASVTNDAPAVFPIGVTTVTWTVTDNAGSTATCTQTVTVSDNVPPTITCPADVAVNTNSGCTATGVALGTPVSSDNCGVATVTNDAPAVFPIGVTTVIWTVTDNAGLTATCTQTVTVSDNVPPTITCPADVAVNTNSGCTATGVALGTPVSSDNCGVATVTNDAPAVFPIGVTTVIWTVTDNAGLTATCTQTVTVSDNVPPTITCPADVAVNTNSGCTATGVALGTPVSSDNCGVASVTNDAPAAFPIGVTTVIWTVTDNAGLTATCTQTVTVSDNVPPTITCPADVAVNTNSGCTATGVALGTPVPLLTTAVWLP